MRESLWDIPPLICKASRRAAFCSLREDPGDSVSLLAPLTLTLTPFSCRQFEGSLFKIPAAGDFIEKLNF